MCASRWKGEEAGQLTIMASMRVDTPSSWLPLSCARLSAACCSRTGLCTIVADAGVCTGLSIRGACAPASALLRALGHVSTRVRRPERDDVLTERRNRA